jgi:hypothetical protein
VNTENTVKPPAEDAIGQRVSEVMAAIFEEIPARVNINAILIDAHTRIRAAIGKLLDEQAANTIAVQRTQEVFQEIATYVVGQFTGRTGQPFEWHDTPDPTENGTADIIMAFKLDEKGNVLVDDTPPPPAPAESASLDDDTNEAGDDIAAVVGSICFEKYVTPRDLASVLNALLARAASTKKG